MITVKLKPVTGDEFSVSFPRSGTVIELKEAISKTYDAPADALRLIYKGMLCKVLRKVSSTSTTTTGAGGGGGERVIRGQEEGKNERINIFQIFYGRSNTEGCSHD